jgi:glycosyltransferase involved in cell wall biosynthesis
MKYCVIIPAHNEELFLLQALNTLVSQTIQPQQVIVVNDNSTDNTGILAEEFAKNHQSIKVLNISSDPQHNPGSKVINAFNRGLEIAIPDYDFVVKMDADITLPENYFARIAEIFSQNPNTGIAGGLVYTQHQGDWKYENISDKEHVRGPVKSYTKNCFQKIGGLRSTLGWDTLDELLARFNGFEVSVDTSLVIKHHRPTGKAYASGAMKKHGAALYAMRYGITLTKITALKTAWRFRSVSLLFVFVWGYLQAWFNQLPRVVSAEEGRFIRSYRWKKILRKLS